MTFEHVLSLLGMSEGLEEAAGNRMKSILEKLTTNRFLGIATDLKDHKISFKEIY